MLLQHFEVNGECLLDDSVIVLSYLAEIEPDSVHLLQLAQKSLLHLSILLELSLLAQFGQLVV